MILFECTAIVLTCHNKNNVCHYKKTCELDLYRTASVTNPSFASMSTPATAWALANHPTHAIAKSKATFTKSFVSKFFFACQWLLLLLSKIIQLLGTVFGAGNKLFLVQFASALKYICRLKTEHNKVPHNQLGIAQLNQIHYKIQGNSKEVTRLQK